MTGIICTPCLNLAPLDRGDAATLTPAILRMADATDGTSAAASEALLAQAADPASGVRLWTLSSATGAFVGIAGLRPPSQVSLRLRAIGWRNLELIIALDPSFRRQGLAQAAVEAMATEAGADGVTFALVACVGETGASFRGLLARCGFHVLGEVATASGPVTVYERAV